MNPSSAGWIKKLLKFLEGNTQFLNYPEDDFYSILRDTGFIYGTNLKVINNHFKEFNLTEAEMCKVNLCLSLLYTHQKLNHGSNFIDSVINFYKEIGEYKLSFFKELLGSSTSSEQLENIIHKRTQIDDNFITKNFNYFLINGLLYIDVLAYRAFIKGDEFSLDYLKNLEASIEAISLNVIISKKEKTEYDESLIKLFESSLRYQNKAHFDYKSAIKFINTPQQKKYILDLACMATWSDKIIEKSEQKFLLKLGNDLKLSLSSVNESIKAINDFYDINKDNIALFSSKNLVQSFYDNSSKVVTTLISRNSKRLYKELIGSKELMVLISQSTVRDLNKEEQKKVQEQLMDIFKSIPSLAIFLLPGGALLLPLVIKFIPKLLPSAFDDNRIEE
ncbi:LETM1-related biofilm-associated protein [Hwangdonia lutea]|uniref:LETM1-related biofilm-associated protein n=1 Tax=Hwangdonia lutea TaxID=3075823 RepID=A0AA97EJZ0_9FLAO|nr:LETM1-related biofilm-associated protein [Hwangdonia sp. SCSIO 19198]WOD42411.1 LETM1-related biofilm-associated protein [Hwangdonia sp. SCSIO 19198]